MCGILAIWQPGGIDEAAARRALAMLRHRGPDAQALWLTPDRTLALGHARLKIIDLSDTANQPMFSDNGRHGLVFNGEIVNFQDVRRRYEARWRFRTRGDSEVLLAGLALRGEEALADCVGMFAFAHYDASSRRLLLARDRFGIKPLYWTRLDGGGIAFASEIPPLLQLRGGVAPDLDTVRTWLETGRYDSGPETFFAGISVIEPGSLATLDLDGGALATRRWYDLASSLPDLGGSGRKRLVDRGRELVEQAVREHLIADVPVGLNVSGGVDSSVLVRIASSTIADLHVFTQDYEAPYSERHWVERVAGGARLHLSALDSGRIGAVIDRTVEAQAEPFGGVTVAGYDYLYAEAEQSGITVLLDGNGVDEVFLGYSKYLRDVGAAAAAGRRPAIDGTDGLMPSAIGPMLATGARTRPPAVAPVLDDGVKRAAALDLLSEKIPRGLRFNDRMSMARSRELRVPFLDHRLVEFGFAVPTTEHLAGGFTKSLFREIAEAWVPAEVARAPKRSVQSPQREWLAGAWRPLVEDLLASKSLAARGWIDPPAARRAFAAYCAGPKENSFFVWQWLTLELWARRFLDGAGS